MNKVTYLSGNKKWYLGGGEKLIWTPGFPVWLDKPGFWDKANFYNLDIEPVFTLTVLDENYNEINLRFKERRWFPSHLRQVYERTEGIDFLEEKYVLSDDTLNSRLSITNNSKKHRRINLIMWTIQKSNHDSGDFVDNIEFDSGSLFYTKNINFRDEIQYRVECGLTCSSSIESYGAQISDGRAIQPIWGYTPFCEKFEDTGLGNVIGSGLTHQDGLVYMGIHTEVILDPETYHASIFTFGAASNKDETKKSLSSAPDSRSVDTSIRNWNEYFEKLPKFECSDEFIQKYYFYRWYGLKLFTLNDQSENYKHPAVFEGPGYFRAFISYSAQCHMLETRWMRDSDIAEGSLLNFVNNQLEDGSFIGHLYPKYLQGDSFYHANWGNILKVFYNHPDKQILKKAYSGLCKYVEYFDRERDRENSGLYDIINHYETGQEFMSRYMAVDETADRENWGEVFRLKGLDSTTYMYEIKSALAIIAQIMGKNDEVEKWDTGAELIKNSILEKMWDPDEEMFFDVNPDGMNRTGVKAATCFYPYFTDIVSEKHLQGLNRHLFNPDEFWTEYPVPSTSKDDKYFSAEGYWKGKRLVCPWNGRVWPMTNSHIAEAIAVSAYRFNNSELRQKAAVFISKFIMMMFHDGDISRPNCYEHYNPLNSKAALYRGVDDYQHSWVVDLIIKYICGVRPELDKIIVDPFPFDLDYFRIDELLVKDRKLTVERNKERFSVTIDGSLFGESEIGTPVEINF